jgi:hypothetical protein
LHIEFGPPPAPVLPGPVEVLDEVAVEDVLLELPGPLEPLGPAESSPMLPVQAAKRAPSPSSALENRKFCAFTLDASGPPRGTENGPTRPVIGSGWAEKR